MGRLSPGAGGVAGAGVDAGIAAGAAEDVATGAGWTGGRGITGAGGGGVYAGTDIGVCDGMNGRATCGVATLAALAASGGETAGAGADGVATEGHGVRGVGRSGGSIAPRGGVTGLSRIGVLTGVCRAAVSAMPTGITPLQAEHRARTPPCGTFAGSTRYVVEHCGQLTFIPRLRRHRECSDASCQIPAAFRLSADQS
jgi:hypothetical protein